MYIILPLGRREIFIAITKKKKKFIAITIKQLKKNYWEVKNKILRMRLTYFEILETSFGALEMSFEEGHG
jgi:hypothetical protein